MGEIQSETSSAMIEWADIERWYKSEATTPTHTAPCEALARFVGRNYGCLGLGQRRSVSFLDIGSGSGANTRYLLDEGYNCIAIDASNEAFAHKHVSIESYLYFEFSPDRPQFDCIFDINTLCHIEDPPYERIYGALKKGGKFFSIHPADGTEVDMTGKGYTRIADIMTMRQLLKRATWQYSIHKCTNWSGDTKINSWQIEADK